MCIHILCDSAVFLCMPSFSVFSFWFLYLPHSALQKLLSQKYHLLLPEKEQSSDPNEMYHLSQCTGNGERGRVPLLQICSFHITHSKQSNSTGSVQHRCIALQFQMIFLACPLCQDLCTKSCSLKQRFINIYQLGYCQSKP